MRSRPAIKLALALITVTSLAVAAYAANRPVGATGSARYVGSYDWRQSDDWFGGFSGLALSADGMRMTVVSDRATLVTARISRADGQITGVRSETLRHLQPPPSNFEPLRVIDSEGLAVAADGTVYISLEGIARVVRHDPATDQAEALPRAAAFRRLPFNKSLELLAIAANGDLYTVPERVLDAKGRIPVWHWNGHNWSTFDTLERRGNFLPVGADIGPDGRFYLLERKFTLVGFRSRLRRWDMQATGLTNEHTLFETRPGTHDNLEGLSVWRDSNKTLRATMISDDNFLAVQRTELVEYLLPAE